MSSKSANYCFANRQASKGVLLLCDVALGKQYLRSSAEYEADKSCRKAKSDSTLGQGKTAPDAAGYRKLPDDAKVTVPMGKGKASDVKNSSLLYDEFIVYDVRSACAAALSGQARHGFHGLPACSLAPPAIWPLTSLGLLSGGAGGADPPEVRAAGRLPVQVTWWALVTASKA